MNEISKSIRNAEIFDINTFSASFNPVFLTIPLYVLKYKKQIKYRITTIGNLNNNFSKLNVFKKLLRIKLLAI